MRAPERLFAAAVLASIGSALAIGQAPGTPAAEASAARSYTLRIGDKVTIPAIGQVCSVQREGGAPRLYCARPRNARHQVTIYRDGILVWKVGDPDRPAWTGKP
jgi:hypothetical protein